jgi:hypothetical protein
VRLGKRDIVPTEVNMRPQYRSFGELKADRPQRINRDRLAQYLDSATGG